MDEFKSRLHDGDSAVSCQALVMLLGNQKTREPGGTHLRSLLDQVLVNFVDGETHRAHVCPEDLLQEARSVAATFANKDVTADDQRHAEDDEPGTDATSKGRKKASEPSDTAAPSPHKGGKGGKRGSKKGVEAGAEDGKRGTGGKRGAKRGDEAGAEEGGQEKRAKNAK